MKPSQGHLEATLAIKRVMGYLGAIVKPTWSQLQATLDSSRSHLGDILKPSQGHLEATLAIKRMMGYFEAILKPPWSHHGAILGQVWAMALLNMAVCEDWRALIVFFFSPNSPSSGNGQYSPPQHREDCDNHLLGISIWVPSTP